MHRSASIRQSIHRWLTVRNEHARDGRLLLFVTFRPPRLFKPSPSSPPEVSSLRPRLLDLTTRPSLPTSLRIGRHAREPEASGGMYLASLASLTRSV